MPRVYSKRASWSATDCRARARPTRGPEKVGPFCWETLSTSDPDAAKAFYGGVLGWKVMPAPGDHGYVFGTEGGAMACDVQKAEHMPPNVLSYIVVENAGADPRGEARRQGPHALEVPTVGLIAVIADPTGAVVGLFQPEAG